MDTDRYTRITLRLPRELHSQLEVHAQRTSKSMNAEIIARLEESFESTSKAVGVDDILRRLDQIEKIIQKD